jgi:hypothetical protein
MTMNNNQIHFGDVLTVGADGYAVQAKADSATTLPAVFMACQTGFDHPPQQALVMSQGFLDKSTWSWTPGQLLYVSDATEGLMTATKPVGAGKFVQPVAIAMSATRIFFNPSLSMVAL